MPLEKGQRVLPDPVPRPMTTKQARKEYLERTRGPKLTKEQQRAEERRLQAEIRRDIKKRDEEAKKAEERERTSIRAKAARDRAKAKEEAEKVAKRKAGKPLKPPRPSQSSIMGFMKGNAATKKRAPAEDDPKLPAIREDSALPESSSGSSTKRRRLSDTEVTNDVPGPEDQEAEEDAPDAEVIDDVLVPKDNGIKEDNPNAEGITLETHVEPAGAEVIVPSQPRADIASPEVQAEQEAELEPPLSGQAEVEPEPHTASGSPTPVSSPRADVKGQIMDVAISFSLDDFEDSLASAAQLDEELLGPDDTPAIDQDTKDTKTAIVEEQSPVRPEGRVVPKPVPDLSSIMPFLSTQDCSLSEADISEIETPVNHGQRRRTWNTATPVPRRPSIALSRSTLHRPQSLPRQNPVIQTPTRQPGPNPSRPPLVPITDPRILAPNTRVNTPTRAVTASMAPPAKSARAAKLTDEDLSALQSEDWDDDLSLGKGPSPRAARSSTAEVSRPGQATSQPMVGPSSSDIRSLALADWSDDM